MEQNEQEECLMWLQGRRIPTVFHLRLEAQENWGVHQFVLEGPKPGR